MTSTFFGENVPCSRTQHGLTQVQLETPTSGSRVRGINHQATVLPRGRVRWETDYIGHHSFCNCCGPNKGLFIGMISCLIWIRRKDMAKPICLLIKDDSNSSCHSSRLNICPYHIGYAHLTYDVPLCTIFTPRFFKAISYAFYAYFSTVECGTVFTRICQVAIENSLHDVKLLHDVGI